MAPDATSTARVASESRASLRCAILGPCSLWNRWLVQGRARTRPDSSLDDAAIRFRLQFTGLSPHPAGPQRLSRSVLASLPPSSPRTQLAPARLDLCNWQDSSRGRSPLRRHAPKPLGCKISSKGAAVDSATAVSLSSSSPPTMRSRSLGLPIVLVRDTTCLLFTWSPLGPWTP